MDWWLNKWRSKAIFVILILQLSSAESAYERAHERAPRIGEKKRKQFAKFRKLNH